MILVCWLHAVLCLCSMLSQWLSYHWILLKSSLSMRLWGQLHTTMCNMALHTLTPFHLCRQLGGNTKLVMDVIRYDPPQIKACKHRNIHVHVCPCSKSVFLHTSGWTCCFCVCRGHCSLLVAMLWCVKQWRKPERWLLEGQSGEG